MKCKRLLFNLEPFCTLPQLIHAATHWKVRTDNFLHISDYCNYRFHAKTSVIRKSFSFSATQISLALYMTSHERWRRNHFPILRRLQGDQPHFRCTWLILFFVAQWLIAIDAMLKPEACVQCVGWSWHGGLGERAATVCLLGKSQQTILGVSEKAYSFSLSCLLTFHNIMIE